MSSQSLPNRILPSKQNALKPDGFACCLCLPSVSQLLPWLAFLYVWLRRIYLVFLRKDLFSKETAKLVKTYIEDAANSGVAVASCASC